MNAFLFRRFRQSTTLNLEGLKPTAEDFQTVWTGGKVYPFFEDEDVTGVYGYGHQNKEEFARAVNEYYDDLCGGLEAESRLSAGDVEHTYAQVTEVYEGREFRFTCDKAKVKPDDPESFPLTMIAL